MQSKELITVWVVGGKKMGVMGKRAKWLFEVGGLRPEAIKLKTQSVRD